MLPDQAGLDVMRIVVEVHSAGNFIVNSEQILSSQSFPQCNGNLEAYEDIKLLPGGVSDLAVFINPD